MRDFELLWHSNILNFFCAKLAFSYYMGKKH